MNSSDLYFDPSPSSAQTILGDEEYARVRHEGTAAEAARWQAIVAADGIKGHPTRLSAALDLAGKSEMSAEGVVRYVTGLVSAAPGAAKAGTDRLSAMAASVYAGRRPNGPATPPKRQSVESADPVAGAVVDFGPPSDPERLSGIAASVYSSRRAGTARDR